MTQAEYQDAIGRALPARQYIIRPRPRCIEPGVRLLHHLGPAAARRPLPRAWPSTAASRAHDARSTSSSRRPSAPSAGDLADPPARGGARRRSTTRPVRSGRSSAGPTTTRRRSTSPPRASDSPARRSSRSSSPRPQGGNLARLGLAVGEADVRRAPPRPARISSVNDAESAYAGSRTARQRHLPVSDNSVFAAVWGSRPATRRSPPAAAADTHTPVSTKDAMTLGGLAPGVTVLDMAHAYETIAHDGQRVYGTLGAPMQGPVGIHSVTVPGHAPPRPQQGRAAPGDAGRTSTRGNSRYESAPSSPRAWARRPTRASGPRARRGRPRTTATPGSSASPAADRGRLGRLPRSPAVDGDRLRRLARGRRHLPGADLARLHRRGGQHLRLARRGGRRQDRPVGETVQTTTTDTARTPQRRRRRRHFEHSDQPPRRADDDDQADPACGRQPAADAGRDDARGRGDARETPAGGADTNATPRVADPGDAGRPPGVGHAGGIRAPGDLAGASGGAQGPSG